MRNQYWITILMFSCLPLPGCAWQHSRPITSATTGRRCMACSTVTAMWRCPISCSAPWVTSWQKSYRRQKMKRNTWSTRSSLCRGESWIWSNFFNLVYASWAVCFQVGHLLLLFSCFKNESGGGKPWYLAIVFSFIVCFVKIALCCFQLWEEKSQSFPTYLNN